MSNTGGGLNGLRKLRPSETVSLYAMKQTTKVPATAVKFSSKSMLILIMSEFVIAQYVVEEAPLFTVWRSNNFVC
jgi:hypothetical protein